MQFLLINEFQTVRKLSLNLDFNFVILYFHLLFTQSDRTMLQEEFLKAGLL